MFRPFLVIIAVALFVVPSMYGWQAAAPPADPTAAATVAPAAAAAPVAIKSSDKVNPVHATPQSLARAKAVYGFECAMCHGVNGDGKGDMNADGKMKVRDWHDPAILKGLSDGDIYGIIDVGRADMPEMPAENGRVKPEEIWNLVIYLRSFAKTPAAAQ